MRLTLLTLAVTLVLPGGLFAQESSACGREPGRTLRGQVVGEESRFFVVGDSAAALGGRALLRDAGSVPPPAPT